MVRTPTAVAFALAAVVVVVAPFRALQAQNVTLDEGRFALFVDGREAGSESFSIHRVGMGPDARILATATVSFEGTEMRPALEAGTDFVVTSYQNEITGRTTASLSVVLNDSRYVSRMRSADGEVQREYRASARTAVLEEHVSHQYYFVARFVDGGAGPVIVLEPAAGRQGRLEVVSTEAEPFRLGDQQLSARHIRLQGGGMMRDLWIDDQGRVLRVEIPSLNFRAERLPGEG